jgi:hypothetical protein
MPTRQDLQGLIEWCDLSVPFGGLKTVVGVALAVHSFDPTGGPPSATARWTGEIVLRAAPGLSELPQEPVRLDGTLVGVRHPDRRPQLRIFADVHHVVVKLSGDHIPPAWATGFEIQNVRGTPVLVDTDWFFVGPGVGSGEPGEVFDGDQSFELLLWPAMRKSVNVFGPP